MGCDIHAFYEVKVDDTWHLYKEADAERNYTQFAILAGVRNSDNITPIAPPRGVPAGASVGYRLQIEEYGIDGHSHSYLYQREFDLFERLYEALRPSEHTFLYYDDMLTEDRELPEPVEEVRLVFFFDN